MDVSKDKKIFTIVFVRQGTRILLGMKRAGFGEKKWNGFGGKVRGNESIEDAAKRELFEESKVQVRVLEKKGIITFSILGEPFARECHIFEVSSWDGVPEETEEMITPEWFETSTMPYADMWPADIHWVPLLLSGKKFVGEVTLLDHNTLGTVSIREVDAL